MINTTPPASSLGMPRHLEASSLTAAYTTSISHGGCWTLKTPLTSSLLKSKSLRFGRPASTLNTRSLHNTETVIMASAWSSMRMELSVPSTCQEQPSTVMTVSARSLEPTANWLSTVLVLSRVDTACVSRI